MLPPPLPPGNTVLASTTGSQGPILLVREAQDVQTPCMVDEKPASPACVKAAVGQDGSSLSSGPQKFLLHPDRWGLRAGRAIVTGDGCGEGGRHPLIRRGSTWKLAQTAHVGGSRINLQPTGLLLSPNTNTSQNTDTKLPNRNSALAGSFQNLMGTKTSTPGSWMIQITEEYLEIIAGNQISMQDTPGKSGGNTFRLGQTH